MEKIKFYLYKEEESQSEDEKRLNKYIENIYYELKTNHHWSPNETNWWEFITDIEFKMLTSMPLDDISGHIEANWKKIDKDHLTTTLRQLKDVYVKTIGEGKDKNAEKLIKILNEALNVKKTNDPLSQKP